MFDEVLLSVAEPTEVQRVKPKLHCMQFQ